jgi:hypothetical protein
VAPRTATPTSALREELGFGPPEGFSASREWCRNPRWKVTLVAGCATGMADPQLRCEL